MTEIKDGKETSEKYMWAIVGILLSAQLVMSMGAYAWGPLAPFFRQDFHVTCTQIGMITSAIYLSATIIALPSGFLVDKLGAKIVLVFCLSIMGFSFCIMPLARSFSIIIICSAASGIGYGMINQVSIKGIMYWCTSRTRATAMGIKQAGVTIGGAVVAILLPAMTVAFGWKTGVLAIGLIMLLMAVAVFIFYREHPESHAPVSAAAKVKRTDTSLLKTLSNPVLFTIIALIPLMTFNQICVTTFWVLYLKEALNFSINTAGLCLTIAMVSGTVGRIWWGIASDRFFDGDRLMPLIILSIVGAVSIFFFGIISVKTSLYVFYFLSALVGFTIVGWNGVYITLAGELAGTELAGSITGIIATAGYIGLVAGPIGFGYMVDKINYFTGWLCLPVISMLTAFGFIYIYMRTRKTCMSKKIESVIA